ncbi:UNVERIFIED_CONTAM: tRNA pseudouridine synthase Pus10 [Sesamum angustifolium]|uniref:tRNA pseudouridine(55) synthase n=1 Tax=Sesamum angustifolium TaxID=2727405 RepID=A0AAW2L583_9LAMI
MATAGAAVDGNHGEARVSSSVEAENDDLKLLRDSVRALPAQPLKDLLSNGVCARCIFRLFSLHEQICPRPSLVTPILSTTLHEVTGCEGDSVSTSPRETKDLSEFESSREVKEEIKVCSVCLGILQFLYNDDNGTLVKKDSASDFAAAMGEVIKQEGHQIDNFSLEVSLPQDVVENEQAVWLYIKEKYSSESWFLEKFPSECFATKDFLKLSVTNPLETLLGIKSNVSSFRVRLTYTLSDASKRNQHMKEKNGFCKRRKIDDSDNFKKDGGFHRVEGLDLTRKSSTDLEDGRVGLLKFPLEKVNRCCSLNFQCYRTSVYVGGRYLKYSRNVSQTRWIIDDERMGEASIEEIVGGNILPMCQGDTYKFHAAGREDIDVRMLGTGRPFLVEIQNARQVPSDVLVKDMENKINSLESKFVKVKNLKVLGNQGWELMREGEAEKQKQYAALVWIPRPLNDDDVQTLASLKDMAGTYIKEFVHGDLGRTHPRYELQSPWNNIDLSFTEIYAYRYLTGQDGIILVPILPEHWLSGVIGSIRWI